MTMTVSEIEVWRRTRRWTWKPWTAQFEDDHAVYAAEAWTARGARRQVDAFRNALRARQAATSDPIVLDAGGKPILRGSESDGDVWIWSGTLAGFQLNLTDDGRVVLYHRCGFEHVVDDGEFLGNLIHGPLADHRRGGCATS